MACPDCLLKDNLFAWKTTKYVPVHILFYVRLDTPQLLAASYAVNAFWL
jgi:hypothetical protein